MLEGWLSVEITYGLYLSDHAILDAVDTELVVLSGIMIQNLKTETAWHLRGTRRIGVSHDDVELIQQCVGVDHRDCCATAKCKKTDREGCGILRITAHSSAEGERY